MGYAHYNVDETPLTALIDTSGGTVIYLGEALPGTATSDPLWRIKKVNISGANISIAWAAGTPTFQNIWDNRASYAYS